MEEDMVEVLFPINPYEVLGVQSTASLEEIKLAFGNKTTQPLRQNRAMVSIAKHILTSSTERYDQLEKNCFSINKLDHYMLVAAGDTRQLAINIEISEESILDKEDEHGRTLLYLACKSGFYDTSKMLLTKGASINKTQRGGSTALHAAAYYGHTLVVGLLLEHGAATDIKNTSGNTALEEARTDEIKVLIQSASKDYISSLAAQLRTKKLVSKVRPVKYKGKLIAKEFVRDLDSLDPSTREQWDHIIGTWEPVWHGTQYKNLPGILEKGLLPTGSNGIEPRPGHISLGKSNFEIENWAAALFVSPSIQYAGHVVYSERVLSESRQWCVLVKARCKPESYESFDPTTSPKYDRQMDGEPDEPEYRIPVKDLHKQVILRVESSRSIVVQSLMFVSLDFLENEKITFEEAKKIFC